jgi:catechol 2,3-dioxygenase-like lactoylglutathione lyase family enzyme
MTHSITEFRIAVTVEDYDAALRFYRDALGMPILQSWEGPAGSGSVLDPGRATLEILSLQQATYVDEIEAGGRSSGHVRFAIAVPDSAALAAGLVDAGARAVHEAVITPWNHRNARLETPDGMQLTLFTRLEGATD